MSIMTIWRESVIIWRCKYGPVKYVENYRPFSYWLSEMTEYYLLWYIDQDIEKLHQVDQFQLDIVCKFHKLQDYWPDWKKSRKTYNYRRSVWNDSKLLLNASNPPTSFLSSAGIHCKAKNMTKSHLTSKNLLTWRCRSFIAIPSLTLVLCMLHEEKRHQIWQMTTLQIMDCQLTSWSSSFMTSLTESAPI